MWKVSWLYEKVQVHNIANFWGYAAILFIQYLCFTKYLSYWQETVKTELYY